jgi:hypothetical protein
MSRIIRSLIPLALAGAAVIATLPAAQAAPAATTRLQIVGAGVESGFGHTIRHADDSWDEYDQLDGSLYNNFYGTYALTSANMGNNDNVVFEYEKGPLHTPTMGFVNRLAMGDWINEPVPDGGAEPGDKLAVAATGDLLTMIRQRDGKLQLATYLMNANWSSWQDTGISGDFRDIALTTKGSVLRLVAAKADGSGFVSIDRTNGVWGKATTVPFKSDDGWNQGVTRIDAVQVGDELQVVMTDEDRVYHTVQHADGTWDAPVGVDTVAGYVERPRDVAAAEVNGELQVVITNETGPNSGYLFHTIRHADGTWDQFGEVDAATGRTNAGLITVTNDTN